MRASAESGDTHAQVALSHTLRDGADGVEKSMFESDKQGLATRPRFSAS